MKAEQTITVKITFRPYDPDDDSWDGSFKVIRVVVLPPEGSADTDTIVEAEANSEPYAMGGNRFWTIFDDPPAGVDLTLTENIP